MRNVSGDCCMKIQGMYTMAIPCIMNLVILLLSNLVYTQYTPTNHQSQTIYLIYLIPINTMKGTHETSPHTIYHLISIPISM